MMKYENLMTTVLSGDNMCGKYRLSISKKSWIRLKEKIKLITKKSLPIPFKERIERLNWLMRGWVNYVKHATGYEKFKYLDTGYDAAYGIASGRLGFLIDPAGSVSDGHRREGTASGWVENVATVLSVSWVCLTAKRDNSAILD